MKLTASIQKSCFIEAILRSIGRKDKEVESCSGNDLGLVSHESGRQNYQYSQLKQEILTYVTKKESKLSSSEPTERRLDQTSRPAERYGISPQDSERKLKPDLGIMHDDDSSLRHDGSSQTWERSDTGSVPLDRLDRPVRAPLSDDMASRVKRTKAYSKYSCESLVGQDICQLSIRFSDGSTTRQQFYSRQKLEAVRQWVVNQRIDDEPFAFRQHTFPSRAITISEEHESLWALGLCPSATLVIVPIRRFSEAYVDGHSGYLDSALGVCSQLISRGARLVSQAYDNLTVASSTEESAAEACPAVEGKTNAHTLRQGETGPTDTSFYNGNQLDFQPRQGDDLNQ